MAYPRRWTDEECALVGAALDKVIADHSELFHKLTGDGGPSDIMAGLAEIVALDREHQTHEVVIACLESVEEHLHRGAFDWYASTK